MFCPTGILGVPVAHGRVFVSSAWPNPFRSNLAVSFSLERAGHVHVGVYSATGQRVKVIHDGELPAGSHSLTWQVDRALPAGMYFYRVETAGLASTGKIARLE